ncbi:hypothetical protein ACFFGT_13865 [Mucilaginibacter angelicae]|uniref:Peptidase n=1 Tax=Mucilaginibacter angelicae TaxID=869718 RepID=A0ABV6L756_9SPHI
MKLIRITTFLIGLLMAVLTIASCKKTKNTVKEEVDPPGAPAKTWQEHWGLHHQLLKRVYYDDNVAIYYDNNMDPSVTWTFKAMSDSWAYVKKNYGDFGKDPRLYCVFHSTVDTTGELGGGHPASWRDSTHDYHNTIDCGLGSWTYPTGEQIGMPVHEIGHIVANASWGHSHEDQNIWHDSKFAEIFIYDVLMNIGRQDEASREYYQLKDATEIFPHPESNWFGGWFYPIWSNYGKGPTISKYFQLYAKYVPSNRDLNWGEWIHFWSGAAGVNLKTQATIAFGWSDEWEEEFNQARIDFPDIKYKD